MPDAAAVKAVTDKQNIGRAMWVEGEDRLVVVDEAAFVAYVLLRHPTKVTITVDPPFRRVLLAHLQAVDGTVIDDDAVPGVELRPSRPHGSTRKTDQARATVEQLL
ncbi:MAG TPA: hypothetical protein VE197_02625 [Mycobacterium sp.]|nr:hypothetical protein [Mycobacterium sp.]